MTDLDLTKLLALYRSVLGDVFPSDATADELARVLSGLSTADSRRLDQALQVAGINGLLANVCPYSTETDWVDDDAAIVLTPELLEQGREYINNMVAKGPVGLGSSTVDADD